MRTSRIQMCALHNRRDLLARCTTETIAIRNGDNVVWQSAAMGTDQDVLAAAWTLSRTFTGESATGLSVTDAWTEPLSMMLALDAQSMNESIREGLKLRSVGNALVDCESRFDCESRQLSKCLVPDLGTTSFSRECPLWVLSRHVRCKKRCLLHSQ